MSHPDSQTIPQDAVTMLRNDHRNLEAQLASYSVLSVLEHQKKQNLIDQMSRDLTAHLEAEEMFLYPEAAVHIKGLVTIMNQGIVEHIRLRFLLKQLKAMSGADSQFDAQVEQLSNSIGKHIALTEEDMFPKTSVSRVNHQKLGKEMQVITTTD